jgi:iron-sulfur cluster assembly protein
MTKEQTSLITKDMTMGEILQKYPESTNIMQSYGLHCLGCHINVFETLEQGTLGHGMTREEMDNMLADLNKLAASAPHEKAESDSLSITELAASKLKELIEKSGKQEYAVHVSVIKGGCAGFTYSMDFVKEPTDSDHVIEMYGIKLIVDKDSFEMLRGTTIDYIETLQGAGFKFNNPNATAGCGKSFH